MYRLDLFLMYCAVTSSFHDTTAVLILVAILFLSDPVAVYLESASYYA